MSNGPAHDAFDLIMDAMKRIQALDEMPEAEFRRYMDTARGLLDYISEERNASPN